MTMNNTAVAQEFITHLEFDSFKREITERIEANEQLSDLRMKRIEAIIDKNMADINSAINLLAEKTQYGFNILNERIEKNNDRITTTNERIDYLEKFFNEKIEHVNSNLSNAIFSLDKKIDEKFEHVTDTLSVAINSVNQRIDDLQTAQSKSLAKWGIGVAIIIGMFQVAVSVALHFLG